MRVFFAYVVLLVAIIVLLTISNLYNWFMFKRNTPKIGFEYFSSRIIKHGDYVCINGRVKEFDHWTRDNEIIDPIKPPTEDNKTDKGNLAFERSGLGYNILPSSSLKDCEFIYGKYGLKWAISEDYSRRAKEMIKQYKERY